VSTGTKGQQQAVRAMTAISDGKGAVLFEETLVRAPAYGEVRIHMAVAGVCHTDHLSLRWDGPLILCHEGAGWVKATVPGVIGLSAGQPVSLSWAIPRGQCRPCLLSQGHLCERTHGIAGYMTPLYGGCPSARDFPRLLGWIDGGRLDIASRVTRRYRLTQLQQAMQDMLEGLNIKGVILFARPEA
jgi:Zn-dependent alcohol dehydrogenase